MSEFPRGWRFTAEGIGGIPAPIVINGIVGISHILTDLHAEMADASAGVTIGMSVQIQGFTTTTVLFAAPGRDSVDLSLQANIGAGVTLTITPAGGSTTANTLSLVTIQGYDI